MYRTLISNDSIQVTVWEPERRTDEHSDRTRRQSVHPLQGAVEGNGERQKQGREISGIVVHEAPTPITQSVGTES